MDDNSQHIALYIPSLGGGGAERVFVNLANAFAARGYSVDLVLVHREGPYLNELHPAVRIVELKAGRVLAAVPALVRYLNGARPDVVLSALDGANITALLAKALSCHNVRVIITEHSLVSRSFGDTNPMQARIFRCLKRCLYPGMDQAVAVSEGAADDLASTIGVRAERIQAVCNPVVTEDILRQATENISHPWFDAPKRPVVIAVGRLVPVKGYPTLIQAFSRLKKRTDARLIILGEGPMRRELEWLVEKFGLNDVVAMPGFVDNPYAYIARADVLALASTFEGAGNVLVEAMAVGTPVVSTDCPTGPREILSGGRYGRLVPVADVEGLADALCKTLSEPVDRDSLKERASYFGVERAAEHYLQVMFPAEAVVS